MALPTIYHAANPVTPESFLLPPCPCCGLGRLRPLCSETYRSAGEDLNYYFYVLPTLLDPPPPAIGPILTSFPHTHRLHATRRSLLPNIVLLTANCISISKHTIHNLPLATSPLRNPYNTTRYLLEWEPKTLRPVWRALAQDASRTMHARAECRCGQNAPDRYTQCGEFVRHVEW